MFQIGRRLAADLFMICSMQKEAFEIRWAKARQLEAAGDIATAIKAYEGILVDEPNRLYARLRVSTLLQLQGAYRRARQHAVEAAEAVRHSRWSDLPYVTSKLLTYDEQQLLLALIRGADWNHRDVIAVSPMLVQHLWLAGAVDDAVELAEIALRKAPQHLQLNYAYGIALGYIGKLEGSVAAFEKCITIDPNYAAAHWSLAYARKQVGTEMDRLSRIEAIVRQENKETERPFLHYAAFKELHDAGHHDAAWKHLADGARIKRKSLDYDGCREAELSEWLLGQVEQNIPSELIRIPAGAVFIVGMPRTGTTVLDRILGNHPSLVSGGELSDFRSALNYALDEFIGPIPSVQSLRRLEASDLGEIGRRYLDKTRWRTSQADVAVVDKHPENFFLSGLIMDAMPSARIICMRRNPMDACFSNLKELFVNHSYAYSYDLIELADHYDRFDRLSRYWATSRPNQFMLVDYESLVSDPEMQARQIFGFLGLPYRIEYADITLNSSAVTTASATQVREPLSKRNIGAWKAYASYLAPLSERLGDMMIESRQARDDII